MAHFIEIKTKKDERGFLSVIESIRDIPFEIKRIFYIYGVGKNAVRGGHRHKRTRMVLICVSGSCVVVTNNGSCEKSYLLDSPKKGLLLEPEDFHKMHDFKKDTVLLTLASEYYDQDDYIHEDYK